jgi:hypothetical protein
MSIYLCRMVCRCMCHIPTPRHGPTTDGVARLAARSGRYIEATRPWRLAMLSCLTGAQQVSTSGSRSSRWALPQRSRQRPRAIRMVPTPWGVGSVGIGNPCLTLPLDAEPSVGLQYELSRGLPPRPPDRHVGTDCQSSRRLMPNLSGKGAGGALHAHRGRRSYRPDLLSAQLMAFTGPRQVGAPRPSRARAA